MKRLFQEWFPSLWLLSIALLLAGCQRNGASASVSEPKITGSPSDPPIELKAQWKSKHLYEVSLQLEQNTNVRNRRTDEDFVQDIQFRLDFNGSTGDTPITTLNLELTGLLLDLIRGDTPLIHYDTRSKIALLEDDQRTTEALDKLVGSKWRYRINSSGKVLSAEMETATGGAKPLPSDSKVTGVALARKLFNPQFFQPFLEFSFLPTNQVRIGDSWPVEMVLSAGAVGAVQFKGTCKVAGWQLSPQGRRCVRLDLAGELSTATKPLARVGKAIQGSADLESGKMTSRIWFDPEQGLPVQTTTDLSMSTVAYVRSKKPREPGDTNAPPAVKLVTPLSQRIKLRISDQGEAAAIPTKI